MSPEPRPMSSITCAVVGALLFEQSVPGQAFYTALDHGEILLSQATFAELSEVLARKKFDRYAAEQKARAVPGHVSAARRH